MIALHFLVTHYFYFFFLNTLSESCQALSGKRGIAWINQMFMLPLRSTPQFTVSSILGLFLRNVISQIYAKIQNVFVLDLWDLKLYDPLQKQSCPKTDLKKFLAHFNEILEVQSSRGERQLYLLNCAFFKKNPKCVINIGPNEFWKPCFLLFCAVTSTFLPHKKKWVCSTGQNKPILLLCDTKNTTMKSA